MNQDELINALRSNLDALERISITSTFACVAIIASTPAAGSDWIIFGIPIGSPKLACVALAIFICAVLVTAVDRFARISDSLSEVDGEHFERAATVIFVHRWMMNPYALLPTSGATRRSDWATRVGESGRAVRSSFFLSAWLMLLLATPVFLTKRIWGGFWPICIAAALAVVIGLPLMEWCRFEASRTQNQLVCDLESVLGDSARKAACDALEIKRKTQNRTLFWGTVMLTAWLIWG